MNKSVTFYDFSSRRPERSYPYMIRVMWVIGTLGKQQIEFVSDQVSEINTWCHKNFFKTQWKQNTPGHYWVDFMFRSKESAMLFKLTWS